MSRSCRWVEADKVLIITQDGKMVPYRVEELETDDRVAKPAFRLHKADGTFYDVSVDKWGPTCTCQDAVYRSRPCKHQLALRSIGKLKKEINHGNSAQDREKEEASESQGIPELEGDEGT